MRGGDVQVGRPERPGMLQFEGSSTYPKMEEQMTKRFKIVLAETKFKESS